MNALATVNRVRLQDLSAITQEEYERACAQIARVDAVRNARKAYVERRGMDPEIFLPAGNWVDRNAQGSFYYRYRLLTDPTYEMINRFRFYTQDFTGYQLFTMQSSHGSTQFEPLAEDVDAELERLAPEPDTWVERFLALTAYLPSDVVARPPKKLGEIGWDVKGQVVNHDVCVYQERLALLYTAGIFSWLRRRVQREGSVNILEIGGGYGGLAYFLKRIVPQANYIICDLTESLLFSSTYLTLSDPNSRHTLYEGNDPAQLRELGPGYTFVPHHLFDDLVRAKPEIALAVNTLSFSEMLEKQVRYYAMHLATLLGETGALFEQNQDNRHVGHIYAKEYLPDYFPHHRDVTLTSVPFLSEGKADIWASRPAL